MSELKTEAQLAKENPIPIPGVWGGHLPHCNRSKGSPGDPYHILYKDGSDLPSDFYEVELETLTEAADLAYTDGLESRLYFAIQPSWVRHGITPIQFVIR